MAKCSPGCTCGRHKGTPRSEETKEKIRAAAKGQVRRPKGYKHSEATKAKQSAAATGRITSDATKAKLSEIVSAAMTPERREIQRQRATGQVVSEETRIKQRAHRHTEETKQQISESLKTSEAYQAAVKSPERNRRIAESRKGQTVSAETRAKIAEKIRPIAPFLFRGGQTAEDFASVLCPAGFIREHHVLWGRKNERFVLDFAHLDGKVNIELDGRSHDDTQERDALRDYVLTTFGWRVIRIKV